MVVIDPSTGRYDGDALPPAVAGVLEPSQDRTDPRGEVTRFFKESDAVATRHGPQARYLVLGYVIGHLLASALLIFKIAFTELPTSARLAIGGVEIAILAGSYFWLFRRHHVAHMNRVRSRMETEITRSFLATWDIRRRSAAGHPPRLPLPGFDRLFRSLRMMRIRPVAGSDFG
jgi:hypothetical protein